jgi:hypothetical protein
MLLKRLGQAQKAATSAAVQAFLESLKPGEAIDLVLNPGTDSMPDIRRATVLDIDLDRGVLVSQPNRKIVATSAGATIEATILRHDRQSPQATRVGFYTAVKEFIDSFQLLGSVQEAVLLELPKEVHQANLRSAFRLVVPPAFAPSIRLRDARQQPIDLAAELVDLAVGGALLRYRSAPGTPPSPPSRPILW